jgi:Flp pilus assembly protein TadG
LALVLPVLVLLGLGAVQVGSTVHDQVLAVHAAREAARAAAVDPDPDSARAAALRSGVLEADRLVVTVKGRSGPGSRVTAEVRYRSAVRVPLLRTALPEVTVTAHATMRVET